MNKIPLSTHKPKSSNPEDSRIIPLEPKELQKTHKKSSGTTPPSHRKKTSATFIQRVWRGYQTRKVLPPFDIKPVKKQSKPIKGSNKQESVDMKTKAGRIISRAVHAYMLRKRANQKRFVKRYIEYCATVVQKYVRGYLVRRVCRAAFKQTQKFRSLLLTVIQGWKTRKIMRRRSIVTLISETRELTAQKETVECLRKKKALVETFNSLYKTGSWTRLPYSSFRIFNVQAKARNSTDNTDLTTNNSTVSVQQPSNRSLQDSPTKANAEAQSGSSPRKNMWTSSRTLPLPRPNEERRPSSRDNDKNKLTRTSSMEKRRLCLWEQKRNTAAVLTETDENSNRSAYVKTATSNEGSPNRSTTQEKREFLKRNMAKYDPKKSIDDAKKKSTLKKKTSKEQICAVPELPTRPATSVPTIRAEERSTRKDDENSMKKAMDQRRPVAESKNLENLIETVRMVQKVVKRAVDSIRDKSAEKERQFMKSSSYMVNTEASELSGREVVPEEKAKAKRPVYRETEELTRSRPNQFIRRVATQEIQDKGKKKPVQSKVDCWNDSKQKDISKKASKTTQNWTDIQTQTQTQAPAQAQATTAVKESKTVLSRRASKSPMDQPRLVRKGTAEEEKKKTNVPQALPKVPQRKELPTVNEQEQRRSRSNNPVLRGRVKNPPTVEKKPEQDSQDQAQPVNTVKTEKKELRPLSLAEARVQRQQARAAATASTNDTLSPRVGFMVNKVKEMDRGFSLERESSEQRLVASDVLSKQSQTKLNPAPKKYEELLVQLELTYKTLKGV